MKTKEFIRRVEELGYQVHDAPESILVYNEYGITYAKILPYQYAISTIGDGFYAHKKHKELYKLCIDYTATPIEDREEEKKFYLKHKYFKCTNGDSRYFQIYEPNGNPWLNAMDSIMGYKKQFTLKEIEEIKEKFNTDLADFELVEVEE